MMRYSFFSSVLFHQEFMLSRHETSVAFSTQKGSRLKPQAHNSLIMLSKSGPLTQLLKVCQSSCTPKYFVLSVFFSTFFLVGNFRDHFWKLSDHGTMPWPWYTVVVLYYIFSFRLLMYIVHKCQSVFGDDVHHQLLPDSRLKLKARRAFVSQYS